jgi:CheY-like chemotaxis protein
MHNILVVDDTPEIIDILCRFLTMKKFNVKKAYGGQEGLDTIARKEPVDLILLDEKMAGIDGVGVLEELKRRDENIPVIVLTSSFGIMQPKRFEDVKYKHFKSLLYKPVRLAELLKVINGVLPPK